MYLPQWNNIKGAADRIKIVQQRHRAKNTKYFNCLLTDSTPDTRLRLPLLCDMRAFLFFRLGRDNTACVVVCYASLFNCWCAMPFSNGGMVLFSKKFGGISKLTNSVGSKLVILAYKPLITSVNQGNLEIIIKFNIKKPQIFSQSVAYLISSWLYYGSKKCNHFLTTPLKNPVFMRVCGLFSLLKLNMHYYI